MWEEIAATSCAVQNMHIQVCCLSLGSFCLLLTCSSSSSFFLLRQASAEPGLACYWSSWHTAARDSSEMAAFLKSGEEDQCLGFFIVAARDPDMKIRRSRRKEKHLNVEWRK